MLYSKEINSIGEYDAVIVGGGASGVCAAVSAAMMGARVAIVERAAVLGGNLTVGHVGPTMGSYGKNTMAERINRLIGCDKRMVQDFELAKIRITELVCEYGIDVLLNTALVDAVVSDNSITDLILASQSGPVRIGGKIFVDATGDGVLSYLAGEEIEYGRDDGLVQPVSIMFTIEGIDPAQNIICRHEEMDTMLRRGSYLELCKKAAASGELPENVNIVRLYPCANPGERMVNATQLCGMNVLDPSKYAEAQNVLRSQMLKVLDFLKNNVEGFENVRIKDSSDGIGVRESRRVVGEYTVTAEDMIAGRRFDDVIVHDAFFPIDIHNPNGAGQAESDGRPVEVRPYDLPYRAVIPEKNNNLYLSGRAISGTHRAHASYRVMNIAMNIGEAVGIGAALCAREGVTPRELDPKKVQAELISRGIEL